jgi:hypothetical protein
LTRYTCCNAVSRYLCNNISLVYRWPDR